MHDSIKFGAADHKRRKEIIKVRTVKHLREKMEENYNIYMAKSTLQNYMQPRHPGLYFCVLYKPEIVIAFVR